MKDDTQLSREQILILTFMGVIGNIVYIHTWIDDYTDRAAWLASVIGILLIIPFAVWVLFLGKFLKNGTLLDIIETGIGKVPSIIICLIYFGINIIISVAHINMFTEMMNTFFLQYTPPWVIMANLVIMGVLFANSKIKTLSRFVEILAVFGVINYFITFTFVFPTNFHIEYILPVFDTTVAGFLKGILYITGSASECLLLLMIFVRYIPTPNKHYRWVVKGIFAGSIVFSLGIFIISAMMSPELAKRIAFGGVNAASLIQIGRYVQGLEVFILTAYQMIAIGKVTMCLFCAWMSLKRIFNNKIPFVLLLFTSVMMLVPSLWICSYNKAYGIAVFAANYITFPFSLFVIMLTSLCVKFKKNKFESVRSQQ